MAAIGYTYAGGRLSQLDRKTYRSGAAQHQYYNFAYNVWGQTTATKVGSRTLSTNTYYNYVNDDTARGGNLKSTAYANGDSISYTYDRFDRLIRKSYNSGSYVVYTYNAEGSLARLSYGDSTGELASYRFEYDSLGRLIRSAELDADGGTVQRTEHIYDGYNRLSRQSWTLGDKTYSESYVYDDPSDTNQNGDGALTQMTTATGAVIDYQYDTLRRLRLRDIDGKAGCEDLILPSLEEYTGICKKYGKVSVLELKNHFAPEDIDAILESIRQQQWLENTIFISFDLPNLLCIRDRLPHQRAQFLISSFPD